MAEGKTVVKIVNPEEDSFTGDEDDGDDDKFEDAVEMPPPLNLDLHSIISDACMCMDLFVNNKFSESKVLFSRYADSSTYHALGYGTCMYMEAAMTFEPASIDAAVEAVRRSVQVCNKQRKHESLIGSLVHRHTQAYYDDLTPEQIHAELCYAECLIERAFLTFVQDENFVSFIRGGLKIKACYSSYKECSRILHKRKWRSTDEKEQFESGVAMGVGLFNLMVSMMPAKVMKLLEFVGFSGDKASGLRELEKGALLTETMRGPLCAMALMGFHVMVTFMLGSGDADIDLVDRLLGLYMKKYPCAAIFIFYAGRIEEVKGHIDEAIIKFEESIASQDKWKPFHHMCYWELMWCYCYTTDWLMAMKYAEKLLSDSKWSKSVYAYQKAAFMLMMEEQTDDTRSHVSQLMEQVPKMKQRIAGKSLPSEKFAVKKSERYFAQSGRLTLAAHELVYTWNGFSILVERPDLLGTIINTVDETLVTLQRDISSLKFYADDYGLALLIKGCALRLTRKHKEAEACFQEIISLDKQITEDRYILPAALYEHARILMTLERLPEAKDLLTRAKQGYKGYSLESRIHFRIHAAFAQLKGLGVSVNDSEEFKEAE